MNEWPVERTARLAAGQADGVLSDINFGEVFPFVTKPLARDGLARYIGPTLGGQIAGLSRHDPLVLDVNPLAFVAGRPYMDLSAYIVLPAIAYHLPMLEAVDQVKGTILADMARTGHLSPISMALSARLRLHLAYARMGLRSLWWLCRLHTPSDLHEAYAHTSSRLRKMVHRPLNQDAPSVLLADLAREFDDETDPTTDGLRHLGLAMGLHQALRRLCAAQVSPALLDDLARGIPLNPTTTISLNLWDLSHEARSLAHVFATTTPAQLPQTLQTTDAGRQWWTRFEDFLYQHGHRGEVELDITTPRWREDPTFLLQTVANYLRHPADTPTPPAMMADGVRRREAAALAIRAQLPFPMRVLFGWLYERYILWMPFREAMKYTWLLGLEQARRVYLELGRRLTAARALTTAEDVFWLRLHELQTWADAGTVTWTPDLLASREREWRHWTTLHPPAVIVGTSAYQTVPTVPVPESRVLRGTAVSAGYAKGMARVITDPHQADLRPGEILVTRYTDPAWTPLFFTAGALITEVGGLLSHGAVVAREIGLPAIVGVKDATTRIPSGCRVVVNATDGTIELL